MIKPAGESLRRLFCVQEVKMDMKGYEKRCFGDLS